jgi:hypothetical protein
MGAFGIALLLGLGGGAWVYSRIYNRTGGNGSASIATAAICGVAIVIILFLLLKMFGV